MDDRVKLDHSIFIHLTEGRLKVSLSLSSALIAKEFLFDSCFHFTNYFFEPLIQIDCERRN